MLPHINYCKIFSCKYCSFCGAFVILFFWPMKWMGGLLCMVTNSILNFSRSIIFYFIYLCCMPLILLISCKCWMDVCAINFLLLQSSNCNGWSNFYTECSIFKIHKRINPPHFTTFILFIYQYPFAISPLSSPALYYTFAEKLF